MTRRRFTPTILTAVLVVALIAGAAVPTTAEHDPDEDSTLGEALEPASNALGYAEGLAKGFYSRVTYDGPDDDAATNRDAAVETFNQYNETLVDYANNRSIHEGEVLQVDCVIDDEAATAYIVADYNDSTGEYDSAQAVTSTDRTVDHTVELRGAACDNAAEEIETFHDEFAEPDKDITRAYAAEMATKYKDDVDEPFTGSDD